MLYFYRFTIAISLYIFTYIFMCPFDYTDRVLFIPPRRAAVALLFIL